MMAVVILGAVALAVAGAVLVCVAWVLVRLSIVYQQSVLEVRRVAEARVAEARAHAVDVVEGYSLAKGNEVRAMQERQQLEQSWADLRAVHQKLVEAQADGKLDHLPEADRHATRMAIERVQQIQVRPNSTPPPPPPPRRNQPLE